MPSISGGRESIALVSRASGKKMLAGGGYFDVFGPYHQHSDEAEALDYCTVL